MNPCENSEEPAIIAILTAESLPTAGPGTVSQTEPSIDSNKLTNPCSAQSYTGPKQNKSRIRRDKSARIAEKARSNHSNEIKDLVKHIAYQQKLARASAPPPTNQDYLTKYLSYIDARLRVMTECNIKNAIKQINIVMDQVDPMDNE